MPIAFVGAAGDSSTTASTLGLTPHASTSDGDVMIAVVSVRGPNTTENAITPPDGWEEIDFLFESGSPSLNVGAYWKEAASEGSEYSWTFGSANESCGSILTYSGANTSTPIHAHSIGGQDTSSATRTTPDMVVSASGCWVVSYFADRSGSTWTGPDTERSEVKVPATSASQVVCDSAATVSTGTTSRTATASAATSVAVQGIIALAPEAEAHSGTATITGSLGLAASGTPAVDGSGEVAGTVALAASGSASIGGSGSFTGLLTLSGMGRADLGIGVPPRPRTRWQLVLGKASGGHELALTEARSRRYTARLNEASDLSFSIDGRLDQAAAIVELQTDVHLLFSTADGTTILDRCRVGPTRDDIDDTAHRVDVTCLDYRAMLDRRTLYSGDTLTFTGEDQTDIAWSLIDATQGHAAGDLGIYKGVVSDFTGIARDRTYEAGDSIGQRVQELSEVQDGFDWDILPDGASSLRFDAWYPQRGSDRGVVLVEGGLATHISRELNPSDYANAIRYTGAEGLNAAEQDAGYLGVPGTFPQGRWDAVLGDDGLTTQAALDQRAAWQLAQSQVVTAVYTVRIKRGGWAGPDHIWVGDTVRLIIPSGRLAVDTSARVHEVEIDIDEDGGETVTLTLGGKRPDFRRWPSVIEQRLSNLERR